MWHFLNRLIPAFVCTILAVLTLSDTVRADSLVLTGDMVIARQLHTAILLNDGRVLIAGGTAGGTTTQLSSAELYDPRTGTFQATGSMNLPRWGHGAALLDDGRVLILGGWISSFTTATATAEIYDPTTEQFTFTGNMSIPRADFPPVVNLGNGQVVVPGGTADGTAAPTRNIDIYDPNTGTFTHIADLVFSRGNHTATRLNDGRILIVGGGGGFTGDDLRITSAEVYDPATNTSTLQTGKTNFTRTRWSSAVTLQDSRGFVVGGGAAADLYDPVTQTFAPTGDPSIVYSDSPNGAVLLQDGRVLVSGNGVRVYDSVADSFTSVDTELVGTDTTTRLQDGKVLVAGSTLAGRATAIFTPTSLPPPPLPQINAVSPSSGPAGTAVSLYGSNFGASQGTSVVNFGATPAAVNSWSDTQIVAVAPTGLSGPVTITVTTAVGTSSGVTFTYTTVTGTCSSVIFVGVRGSGESYDNNLGMGKTVKAVYDEVATKIPNLQTWGVPYDAIPVFPIDTFNVGDSVAIGELFVRAFLKQKIAECPSMKFLLVGYSQGAMVVADVVNAVDEATATHIVGVGMLGDPEFNSHSKIDAGNYKSLDGIFGARLDFNKDFTKKTTSYCIAGDFICNYSLANLLACDADCPHFAYASYPPNKLTYAQMLGDWLAKQVK